MISNDSNTPREGFTPEGCIATIPPQSARSCELVIEALARELGLVNGLLFSALEHHIHEYSTPDEVRRECEYTRGWRRAQQFLTELQEDWPHLNV